MNFSVFEIEDFIASEWYVIVDAVVFLIFLFLVPELGVTLWVTLGISILRGSFRAEKTSYAFSADDLERGL